MGTDRTDVANMKGSSPTQCPIIGSTQNWQSAEQDILLWAHGSTMPTHALAFHVISRGFSQNVSFRNFGNQLVTEDTIRLKKVDGLEYVLWRFGEHFRIHDVDTKLSRIKQLDHMARGSNESIESFRNRFLALLQQVKADGIAEHYRQFLYQIPGQKDVFASSAPATWRFIMGARFTPEQLSMIRSQLDWTSKGVELDQILTIVSNLFFSNFVTNPRSNNDRTFAAIEDVHDDVEDLTHVFQTASFDSTFDPADIDIDDDNILTGEPHTESNVHWDEQTARWILYEDDAEFHVDWDNEIEDYVFADGEWIGLAAGNCRKCGRYGHWGNECWRNVRSNNFKPHNSRNRKGGSKGYSRSKGKGKGGKGRKGAGRSRVPSRYRDDRFNSMRNAKGRGKGGKNKPRVYLEEDITPIPDDPSQSTTSPTNVFYENISYSNIFLSIQEDSEDESDFPETSEEMTAPETNAAPETSEEMTSSVNVSENVAEAAPDSETYVAQQIADENEKIGDESRDNLQKSLEQCRKFIEDPQEFKCTGDIANNMRYLNDALGFLSTKCGQEILLTCSPDLNKDNFGYLVSSYFHGTKENGIGLDHMQVFQDALKSRRDFRDLSAESDVTTRYRLDKISSIIVKDAEKTAHSAVRSLLSSMKMLASGEPFSFENFSWMKTYSILNAGPIWNKLAKEFGEVFMIIPTSKSNSRPVQSSASTDGSRKIANFNVNDQFHDVSPEHKKQWENAKALEVEKLQEPQPFLYEEDRSRGHRESNPFMSRDRTYKNYEDKFRSPYGPNEPDSEFVTPNQNFDDRRSNFDSGISEIPKEVGITHKRLPSMPVISDDSRYENFRSKHNFGYDRPGRSPDRNRAESSHYREYTRDDNRAEYSRFRDSPNRSPITSSGFGQVYRRNEHDDRNRSVTDRDCPTYAEHRRDRNYRGPFNPPPYRNERMEEHERSLHRQRKQSADYDLFVSWDDPEDGSNGTFETVLATGTGTTNAPPLIIDCGASRSMGSHEYVSQLHKLMGGTFDKDANTTFRFAGSGKETSAGAYNINAKCFGNSAQLQIHSIKSRGTPILFSMATLRSLNAVLYCGQNVMSVHPNGSRQRTFLQLNQEKSGHMTLDLANPRILNHAEVQSFLSKLRGGQNQSFARRS